VALDEAEDLVINPPKEELVQVDSEGVKYSTKLEGGPTLTKLRQKRLNQLYKNKDEVARNRSSSP